MSPQNQKSGEWNKLQGESEATAPEALYSVIRVSPGRSQSRGLTSDIALNHTRIVRMKTNRSNCIALRTFDHVTLRVCITILSKFRLILGAWSQLHVIHRPHFTTQHQTRISILYQLSAKHVVHAVSTIWRESIREWTRCGGRTGRRSKLCPTAE
jgi:hypothetical protein